MTEEMTPKTLINICGAQRSGSTMLDLILGNDPLPPDHTAVYRGESVEGGRR